MSILEGTAVTTTPYKRSVKLSRVGGLSQVPMQGNFFKVAVYQWKHFEA